MTDERADTTRGEAMIRLTVYAGPPPEGDSRMQSTKVHYVAEADLSERLRLLGLEWKQADYFPCRQTVITLDPVPPSNDVPEGERAQLDAVYAERNAIALAFAWMAASAGWKVGQVVDPDEPDWPVLMIDTPHGQVSWHFTRDQMPGLVAYPGEWDGHSDDEKSSRLAALVASPVQPSPDPVRAAKAIYLALPPGGDLDWESTKDAYLNAARAALGSVREPGPPYPYPNRKRLSMSVSPAYTRAMNSLAAGLVQKTSLDACIEEKHKPMDYLYLAERALDWALKDGSLMLTPDPDVADPPSEPGSHEEGRDG